MIKFYFNRFEKIAGLFVIGGIFVVLMAWVGAAIKQGWLEPKVNFFCKFDSGEGLYPGIDVLLSGIHVGKVLDVELQKNNQVLVKMDVLAKYQDRIRQNSQAMLIRPFVFGERAIEITLGDSSQPMILADSEITTKPSFDVMSMLSGRMINNNLESIGKALSNLSFVITSVLEKERLEGFVRTLDRIDPLIKHMDQMSREITSVSKQVNKNNNIGLLVQDLGNLSRELNMAMPAIKDKAPQMAKNFETLVTNLAVLSDQFKVIGPVIAEMGPELPGATRKAFEALDETVTLLKAMQKSYFLRSHVETVKQEESEAGAESKSERQPAAQP